MKYSLVAVVAAFATLMTACGNDSSTGAEMQREVFTGEPVTFLTPGTYTVNKKKQQLVMAKDVGKQDVCNFENGKYSWGPAEKAAEPDTFKYEFHGDTLVLFEVLHGKTSDYGAMYVGGKGGKIEGTWINVECEYISYSEETKCYDGGYKKYSLEFSNGKYTKKTDHYFDDYHKEVENTNFVYNFIIYELYEGLVGWSPNMFLPNIFGSDGDEKIDSTIQKYGIKILESSDSSQTFTVRKKTYTFKVNQAEQSLGATGRILMEINVEVTDGKTTCVGDYHLREVEKEQCSAKYEDDYMISSDHYDRDHPVKDRTAYLLENIEEFEKCIAGIAEDLPERHSDDDDLKESEK